MVYLIHKNQKGVVTMLKKFIPILLVLTLIASLASLAFAADDATLASKVMTKETYVAKDGTSLPYRLYVPEDYDAEKEYSFLLFLHGAGNRGNENESQVSMHVALLDRIIGGEEIKNGEETIDASKEFIIIAPQCDEESQWVDTSWSVLPDPSYKLDEVPQSRFMTAVVELIEKMQADYSLNDGRMYVTGLSMGGFGTWDLITRYPELFDAAIPLGGAGDVSKAEIIKNTPVWTFHQLQDPTVAPDGTLAMVKALTEVGAEVKFTPYFDGVHNAWTKGYAEPDMLNWLYSHSDGEVNLPLGGESITAGASDWAKGEIALASAAGIMPLELHEDFLADITREEFCKMVVNMLPKDLEATREAAFTDTDSEAVKYAYSVGVVNGVSDEKFDPERTATRQEIAAMLFRAYKLLAPEAALTAESTAPDRASVSDWAIESVDFMNEQQIMKGDGNGNLNPLANTTREQAVLLVYRAFCSANRYGK